MMPVSKVDLLLQSTMKVVFEWNSGSSGGNSVVAEAVEWLSGPVVVVAVGSVVVGPSVPIVDSKAGTYSYAQLSERFPLELYRKLLFVPGSFSSVVHARQTPAECTGTAQKYLRVTLQSMSFQRPCKNCFP